MIMVRIRIRVSVRFSSLDINILSILKSHDRENNKHSLKIAITLRCSVLLNSGNKNHIFYLNFGSFRFTPMLK